MLIREPPKQRRADQLRRRVRCGQQPDRQLVGAIRLGVIGQQRQNQAEAEQINKDNQKDRQQSMTFCTFTHFLPHGQ